MHNLFDDDLSQIRLADVEQFLNLGGPENARPIEGPLLDFKGTPPQDIGRDVAALANTFGGILLLGVETNKERKNIPARLPGADLGPDPRARLTDMILATVHPRPDFAVLPLKAADPGKTVAVIRVRECMFPPYEFAQGATVGIPVRIGDTTRQATLREIESLLEKRRMMGQDAQMLAKPYLDESGFYCSVEGRGDQAGQFHRDPQFQKVFLIPRVPVKTRLDLKFERDFESLVRKTYRLEPNFCRARQHVTYSEDWHPGYNSVEYEFRITGAAPCHRVWRVWADGACGFTTNHSRGTDPEPVGNLALELLLFLRLAKSLFERRGYYGSSVLSYTVACPSHKFAAEFPFIDLDISGHYDAVDGLSFHTPTPAQAEKSTFVEDLDWETLGQPDDLITSVLLDQLRSIAAARVDYEKLLRHVNNLSLSLFASQT